MNKKPVISVAISIMFGIGAILIAQSWLDTNKQSAPENQVYIAFSTMVIPIGTVITPKHVELKVLPESMSPDNTIANPDEIYGMIAKDTIYIDDIIRLERLLVKGEGSTLASLISENMRAVSIRVDDVVGVAGFLLPGNRVDILNTSTGNSGTANTEVILRNIKILAIDQRAASTTGENKPQIVRAITVEVNLDQAEILMTARNKGRLQLALRNPTDSNAIDFASNEQIKSNNDDIIEIAPPVFQPRPIKQRASKHKVEIIRGTVQESVQLKI
ncbi:Flp pilus assembly protein CpaB [Moritella sp. Urea-trap-13]|uniref:Flp pilus assembly protein CpaB n=1 Tax=Moritella sp. Urea-trap-13 TaxID=2058327 RepID=UPI000C338C47|nr:Flp pilus assembly protein CpaB [Moritella sp. Urea-trap-13]PKH06287.1 Flp pilus assembly protein CpaB [Moritella sp. Urea-trap-13]